MMAYNYNAPYGGMNGYPQPQFYQQGNAPADMLNQYKMPYQQPQPIQMPIPPVPPATTTNDIIWVQGEEGAKAYLVAPNNTVTLWDSENQSIYIKSADASGIPSMRVLDWTERHATPKEEKPHECKCGGKFVKIDDFNELKARFESLVARFEDLSAAKKTKTAKAKEENENG